MSFGGTLHNADGNLITNPVEIAEAVHLQALDGTVIKPMEAERVVRERGVFDTIKETAANR